MHTFPLKGYVGIQNFAHDMNGDQIYFKDFAERDVTTWIFMFVLYDKFQNLDLSVAKRCQLTLSRKQVSSTGVQK